ncbi:MAG: PD-(D/E)XK nuclease family protein [Eubacterium sp.]|nr:PD-(D/E)XK nuclease family protein [Candidatus Colimonas fimequi]
MFATIDYWKKLKLSVSLEELIRTLLEETGYYDYCSGLPVGKQRASNLRLLLEKAADFERTNYTGLHGFLGYVDAMIERDVKVGEAKAIGESEDVVRLMTIHGSKGLEFPIVILAGMGKKMTGNNSKGSIDFHKDYALAIPFVNKEEAWHRKTLLQRAIVARKREESIDEEIRILYVALTRAKDKLILMGSCRDIEKLPTDVPKMTSYLNVVFPLISDKCDFKIIESQGDYDGDVERVDGNDPLELMEIARSGRDEDAIAQIDKRLSYVYPYDDNNVRSKYSVSQLNHLEIDRQPVMLNKSLFSEKKRELTAAEIGTAMHAVMERMDFARGLAEGIDYIREKADEMLTAGQLTAEERAALNEENIAAFFKTDIGRRAATAADLHKEREFILLTDVEGTEAIVQGIIDCYFVEDDGIVLIDYKNSYMGGDTTEEVIRQRYEKQILLYKEALEGATGLPVKESYLYLFNLQNFTQIT